MEFSRPEYFSSPGDIPNPGLPNCRRILYQLSHQGSSRILVWLAYPFSSRSSQPRNRTGVSFIAGRFFTNWAISEAYPGESSVITGVLTSNRGRPQSQSQSQRRRCDDKSRGQRDVIARKRPQVKSAVTLEAGKSRYELFSRASKRKADLAAFWW